MTNDSPNHSYRLVWNESSHSYQAVPETARGRGRSCAGRTRRAQVVALAAAAALASSAWAGPSGGSISAGSGSIQHSGNSTTVTQGSQNLAINWTSFSIGAGESVRFVQPNSSAIALNRVTGRESSVIDGALTANGQVWLLNANGVLFGKTASVNVGGLVASTLSLSDADFMAGKTSLRGDGRQGSVVNQGSLTGGYVALLGKQVSNAGTITTRGGTSALAAGDAITLSFTGNKLLSVQVNAGTYKALAENSGLIQADDGSVLLSASAKDALLDTVVNNTGVIQARGISSDGGRIVLQGGSDGGTVNVAGTLDASSSSHDGGFIETSGVHVKIADGASISTLSASGKTGTWLVDPTDFTIGSGSGAQTDSGIGATTLSNNLASNNVTLVTDSTTGSDVGNINVNAAVSWSANTTLTLNAYNNINVNAAITATGASAGLVLNYGNYATAGSVTSGTDYNIAAPITLSGANASLSINGSSYTLIHSMAQLDAIDSTGPSGKYALAEDLDASGTTYSDSVVSGTFSGTFAGLGHSVSNPTIVAGTKGDVGLFSTNSGTIRDLGVVGGSVSGGNRVGALVGTSTNSGKLTNVFASSAVQGTGTAIGGLVGSIQYSGSLSGAYATGNVSGKKNVGGLVGHSQYGTLSRVYATGAVTALSENAGGLIGYMSSSTMSNAYATGQVTASSSAGGLIGNSYSGTVSNSYWDSSTTGKTQAYGSRNSASFTNVSAVTSSSAYSHASYSSLGTWTQTVTGSDANTSSGVWVATDGSGTKQWVMIEGSTRPFLYSEYSTSISNAHQLQLMAVNLGASYTLSRNIDASETNGSNASGMWTTLGFSPVGKENAIFSGSLDGNNHTVTGLTIHRIDSSNSNYLFTGLFGKSSGSISNIGLLGGSIAGGWAVGALVGWNEGSVSNAYATSDVSGVLDYVGGLVGANTSSGSISNAHATGKVSGNVVGGLVGLSEGSISNAYATGKVSGSVVGGLVGASYGSISNAYATGNVSGSDDFVGGLVGFTSRSSNISNAYATGSVSGSGDYVGGLVGTSEGSISNAYATGSVTGAGAHVGALLGNNDGALSSSFWLTSVSSTGVGGGTGTIDTASRGLSAVEASTASTFSDAGWSIANAGGSSSIWRIYEGSTTPLLRSFLTALTVTTNDVSKIYDGSTSVSGAIYTLSDADANGNLVLGSFSTGSKNVGSYTLNASGLYSVQQGYDLSFVNGTATITAKAITGAIVADGKVYDRTTSATTSGTLSGVIDGDSVTLATSGSFADKNAGVGKTVNVAGSLSGGDAGNYTLSTNASTTATITAKAITGAIVADGKVYDGTRAATTSGTLTGVVDGDSVALATNGSFLDKNAGIGKTVNVVGDLSGTDAGNYTLSTNSSTTATITAKAISGAIVADGKVYDGTTSATTSGTLSGVVDGDSVALATSGSFADKNAGAGKTVNVAGDLSGTDAGNYTLSTNATTTATITAKAISGAIVADGKVYDGTRAAVTSGKLSGVIDGDSVALATNGSFLDKNAGVGKTVTVSGSLSGSDAGNYTLSSNGTTTATITAKAISGAIVADGKVYDGTRAAATSGSLSGVIDGDSVALATSGSFADKNAGAGKTVNVAGDLSGTDAGNYTLSTNSSTTATITAKAISGAIVADGKVYDGTRTAATSGTLSGVVDGDSVALATSGSFADKNAGIAKTVAVAGDLSGTDAGNYTLTTNASTTATITAKAISGAIVADGKVYDGTRAATTSGTLTGVVDGDSVALATSGSFLDKNVGVGKTVNVAGDLSGTDAGNYTLSTNATTTATITAKAISGAIVAEGKAYDGTRAAATSGTLSGVIDGDSVTLATSGSFQDKNAGVGKTVTVAGELSGTDAGNYTLSSSNATTTATITAKAISGAIVAEGKVYDGTRAAATSGSLSGVIDGDSVALATSGSFADKNAGAGKTVKVAADLSGTDAGNYTLTTNASTTATITAKAITGAIVVDGKVYDGTRAATTSGTLTGVVDGDSVALATSGSFLDKNAGVGKTVNVAGNLSGTDAGNYTLSSSNTTTTATITAKAISGAIVADGKVYDGTRTAATSGTLSGVIDGDSVALATSGAFADKNAGVGKTVNVAGDLSGTDAGNYTLSTNATTTATITAKAISGAIVAEGKVYDGTRAAATSGTLSGVFDGDTVALATSGSFADKNAGVGKTVTVSGSLSGSDAGNYTLSSTNTSTTATITAKAISGAIVAEGKVYDGTRAAATSGTLSGVFDGDTVALATSGSFADKNAGAGKTVNVAGDLSGTDAGNYTLSTNSSTTATITAKAISGAIVADGKVYDGTRTAATSGTLSGVVDGDSVTLATSGSFADKNAGAGKTVNVAADLSGTDAGNYTLSTNASTTATITAKAISGAIVADGKVYDGTRAAVTSGKLSGVIDGDSVALATSGSFADKNAGIGKTVNVAGDLSGADAGNYTLSTNTSTTATITAKAISGAIVADGKVYDGTRTAATSGTLSGVVDGDSVTLATSGSFADKNAGAGKTVNVAGDLSGTDAGNYTLSTNSSTTATITAKAISGAIVADGKVYDGTRTAATSGTLSGVVDGDSVTLATSGSFADKNAGAGKTVNVAGDLSGTDAGNYTLSTNATTTATITAKAISGAIVADGKVYDGTRAAATSGTLSGVIDGDSVALATSGAFADKNAGVGKTVNVAGSLSGGDAGNYTLSTNATTTATITAKAISGAIVAEGKVYDGTTAAATSGTLSGVIDGDSVALATSGSFADKNAGIGKTVNVAADLSGTDAANYTLSTNTSTTATVSKAALTITAHDDRKTADGRPYAGGNGVGISGLVGAETADVLAGSLAYGGSSQGATTAGIYTITAQGLSSDNYSIRYVDGALSIEPVVPTRLEEVQQRTEQQNTSPRSEPGKSTVASERVTRVPDGGLQRSSGSPLLRIANGGLSVPLED
ncbi:filamentous hemagglutinin [Rubrivivax gelatinosus]|nr:filamentous hemagglutinin [Rubrivivax gelatinosus]